MYRKASPYMQNGHFIRSIHERHTSMYRTQAQHTAYIALLSTIDECEQRMDTVMNVEVPSCIDFLDVQDPIAKRRKV